VPDEDVLTRNIRQAYDGVCTVPPTSLNPNSREDVDVLLIRQTEDNAHAACRPQFPITPGSTRPDDAKLDIRQAYDYLGWRSQHRPSEDRVL
jgi:hypothetical protein